MNITIHRDGQNLGPYTLEQVKEYLADGTLTESDLAWCEGCRDWLPLKDVITSVTTSPSSPNLPLPPLVVPPSLPTKAATGDKSSPQSQTVKYRWSRSSIYLGLGALGLLLIIILRATPAYYSNSGLPQWQKDSDLPQDPTGHQVSSGTFKIIQIISPGRVLAAKYVYEFGTTMPGNQIYLLKGIPPTLVDDETWSGEYFESGTVTYTTTTNVEKTVRSYIVVDTVAEKAAAQKKTEAEQAAAQRQAEAEQVEQAAQQEKEFVNDLSQARDALSSANVNDAENLLTVASQLKPDDKRLDDLKKQIKKAQFGVIIKSFQDSIQAGKVTNALSDFNKAKEISSNDSSLPSLQSKLDGLKDNMFHGIDTKLASLDIDGADKDYTDLAVSFPDESRLVNYKAKIVRAKFDLATKAFHHAIQSQDIAAASAKFDETTALIPNETSLGQLQSELVEAKFTKGSNALKTNLANSQFGDAKKELLTLQALNVEAEQTATLVKQVSTGIKDAISSTVNRGKDALRSSNLDQAGQALADAATLDSTNPEVLAFEVQFGAKGQWDKVVDTAQKAHDSDPDNADTTRLLAVAKDGLDKQHRATAETLLTKAREAAAKSDWNKALELSTASIQMSPSPEASSLASRSQFWLLPLLKVKNDHGYHSTPLADGTKVRVVGKILPYPPLVAGSNTCLYLVLEEGGDTFRLCAYFDPPIDTTSPANTRLIPGATCELTGIIGDVSGGPFKGQWAASGPYLYNTAIVAP